MSRFVIALAVAAGLFGLSVSQADAGESGYDGTWAVDLVTESGMCEARYAYTLSVQGGQVRPVSRASSNGASISGRVGADGSVGLSVTTSAASGTAVGRLQARSGSGTWRVSSLCSGRWTARRGNTRTAQAD